MFHKQLGFKLYRNLVNGLDNRCVRQAAALPEQSIALDDPAMWWNKVVQADREELRVFREIGEYDVSLETLEHVRDMWVNNRKTTQFELDDSLEVVPLWVAVHQVQPDAPANLYVTKIPTMVSASAESVYRLPSQATVTSCNFTLCDGHEGGWHNYFIGVKGVIGGEEHQVMWPNWVYHGNRLTMNCRGWKDVLNFLADPTKEAIMQHLENAKKMQEDRGYHEGWCLHRLTSRWGVAPLVKYEIDV